MVFALPIWVDWDRQPVSVHGDEQALLEDLILYLRQQHNVRKRSLVMPDRENGGFVFFFTNHATLGGLLNSCIGIEVVIWENVKTSRCPPVRSMSLLSWLACLIQETSVLSAGSC